MNMLTLRTLPILPLLIITACDPSLLGDDGNPGPEVDCAKLAADWQAAVMPLGASCDRDSDCLMVGWPRTASGVPTCSCAPAISASCGLVVNGAEYAASSAVMLENDFYAQCGDWAAGQVCDCGTIAVTCSGGLCAAGAPMCSGE